MLLIAACSSDSSDVTTPPPPPQPPAQDPPLTSGSVVVAQTAVMLTAVGQTRQLSVRTMNDAGVTVNAAVTWSSSAPSQVSVDATGRVTARTIGSAQVFAQSGSVRSAPVFVVVAQPQPGALLVTDAQVISVGLPMGLAPGEVPTVGTQYEVRLTGITTPPSPGTVVLAAGNAMVAGKVVSVRTESGAMVVTLAMAPLGQLLAQYDINWSIDLTTLPTAALQTAASVAPPVSPRVRVAPWMSAAPTILRPISVIDCDASLGPVLLDRKVQLAPTGSVSLEVVDAPGHTRRALVGSLTLVGTVSLKLKAGFSFHSKCEVSVPIPIPIGGPLAVGVMPLARLGVGVSLDGSIAVTAGEISATGELGAQLEVGWECGGASASCRSLPGLTPVNKFTPKYEVFNPATGMRVEVQGQFYLLAALDAVFAMAIDFGILEAKAGPVQSVDLGFEDDQAINKSYASKYDLKLEAVIQPGSGLQKVLDLIMSGISLTFQGKVSTVLSESPKGALTVSRPVVGLSGQTVDMRVDLTNTDYFLIGYNVVRVELWQKRSTESDFKRLRAFNVTASNQTVFTHTWQPTTDDLGVNEFAVFVYTQFPVPGLEVAENSIKEVEVKCFSASPRLVGGVAAAANTCADTWEGTTTFFAPGQIRVDANVTWRRDPATPEIDGDVVYIATGTATVQWIELEARGCSVSRSVFPINGDNVTDNNTLLVEFGETPPVYSGSGGIPLVPKVSCPNEPPFDYPLAMVWFLGAGNLTGGGALIQGRTDAGGGVYWEWRFARP